MNGEGHLNEYEASIVAEFLLSGGNQYPEAILALNPHLTECHQCRMKIMEIMDIISILGPDPLFNLQAGRDARGKDLVGRIRKFLEVMFMRLFPKKSLLLSHGKPSI